MNTYQMLEFLHVLSSTILFGTGIGIAYFMLMAVNSGDLKTICMTLDHVVRADWMFTTPVIIVQPLTGILLMKILGFSFSSAWFYVVIGLYIMAGACWIPVVLMQYRMRNMAQAVSDMNALPKEFFVMFLRWKLLGYTAFSALLVILAMMVYKPGL